DVLRAFIAVVGMRGVGEHLKGVLDAVRHPIKEWGTLWRFGRNRLAARLSTPDVPVRSAGLRTAARELSKRVRDFGVAVHRTLVHFRKAALKNAAAHPGTSEELLIAQEVLKGQYLQERIADAACDLYASSCTLSRLDHLLLHGNHAPDEVNRDVAAGRYFLRLADRRIRNNLAALWDNDDAQTTATANTILERFP